MAFAARSMASFQLISSQWSLPGARYSGFVARSFEFGIVA